MAPRHDEIESFLTKRDCGQDVGQALEIRDAHVRNATSGVVDHVAVHTFAQLDLDARPGLAIVGDHPGQKAIGDRHDAGYDDLPALLVGELAHAAYHDPKVVDHALRHRNELLAGRRHLNAARRALEDAHP